MNIISTTVALISLSLTACSQKRNISNLSLNLDFEQHDKGYPIKWKDSGSDNYNIYLDSLQAKSGRYSVVIENTGDSTGFKALSLVLPDNYNGKSVHLSGYIKTKDVRNGFAGLLMRIDPKIAFDNMGTRGITGTTDWQKYEVTLQLSPEKTEKILIGGLLVGKGKMWLDDLQVTIDGKTLDDPKLKLWGSNAERDREFINGSNIVIPKLNNQDIDNLELLGRIWGFLKYYHPNIAKGEYNWDFELFRILPDYLTIKNSSERDDVLDKWIKKLGRLSSCTTCQKTADNALLKPDLTWIDLSGMSSNLTRSLKNIYNNRNQREHYYISVNAEVGNPDFRNEKLYIDMPYPDDGFRLLSLFKYWNMIHYFFPYKDLTDKDWNIVLREYIPVFLSAKTELEYELATVRIIGEINDTHGNLWEGGEKIQQLRGNMHAPFKTDFMENKLVVTDFYSSDFYKKSPIKKGDIITHVNGKTIESIVDSLRPYYPHSNTASMLRDMSSDLLRSADRKINISYKSSNQKKQINIRLYNKTDLGIQEWYLAKKKQPTYKLLADSIGYFSLANVEFSDIHKLKKKLGDLKGIVIDIRNYPNQFVALPITSLFLTQPIEFVRFSKVNLFNPGEFNLSKGPIIEPQKYNYKGKYIAIFKGKVIILLNETSQSQAEYTAMALRSVPNSLIIGSTTAGADGNYSVIKLPGGVSTGISGIGVYYPDGRQTQRIGIVPDIFINPTIEGIKTGKDEVLEKAIEILQQ